MVEEENPWAGSLRHVTDKPRKGGKKEASDDLYGGAPWMGTLRHVVHDNKVTRNYGVNQHQSKRYPDEDAGNPFEASQGFIKININKNYTMMLIRKQCQACLPPDPRCHHQRLRDVPGRDGQARGGGGGGSHQE